MKWGEENMSPPSEGLPGPYQLYVAEETAVRCHPGLPAIGNKDRASS